MDATDCVDLLRLSARETEMKLSLILLAASLMNAFCIPSIVQQKKREFERFLSAACKVTNVF